MKIARLGKLTLPVSKNYQLYYGRADLLYDVSARG